MNIFIKRFVGLLLIILSTLVSDAQEKTGTPSFEQQFELFKQQSVQKHQSFISRNDSIFIAFLKKSWKTVKLVDGISNSIIKPKNQPEFKKEFIEEKVQILLDTTPTVPIVYFTADSIQKQSELKSDMPVNYNARVVKQSFDFFGSQEIINVWPDIKPRFTLVSENAIVDFYTSLSKNNQYWGQYLSQLAKLQEKYMLNDWGFYQLAKHAAYSLYDEPNEQRLFCWYLLLKSGYRAKLGYNDAEVYILLPASNKLFSVPYFIESGEVYYLVDASKKKLNNIQTYEMDYPGNQKLFSFELFHYPFFEGDLVSRTINYKGKQYTFEFDKGKLDFLSTYPQCELKLYFKGGITSKNLTTLDGLINPLIKGLTNRQILDVLLDFCQTAFPYATDQDQFNKERYLFSEESLYYPFNDCEDRTVLLSTLVKRYTGLGSVGVDFPGHVTLAVNIPGEKTGNFISYRDQRYLICDPTYINAKSGLIPDEYKTMKAKVVLF